MFKFNKSSGLYVTMGAFFDVFAKTTELNGSVKSIDSIEIIKSLDTSKIAEWVKKNINSKIKNDFNKSIIGISPSSQVIHRVKLDNKTNNQLPKILPSILKERFNIDIKSYKIASLDSDSGKTILPESRPENVILCGAEFKEIQKFQSSVVSIGLIPEQLELTMLANIGTCLLYAKLENFSEPFLLLEMNMDKTQIIICQKGKIIASYPIAFGFNQLINLVKKEKNFPDIISAQDFLLEDGIQDDNLRGKLIERLIKELKSYIAFNEVQANQSVSSLLCLSLPENLNWISDQLIESLDIRKFEIDYSKLFSKLKIELKPDVQKKINNSSAIFGAISLIANKQNIES